ncbi:Uma2 family endonuclease [Candidatus Poriferisodalis sp.]|uniref:Uma2 family endonuclease n=1 Tax=Candidatus Poriferisodalis sp. TaxID=3101277 RepID=UPI003B014263
MKTATESSPTTLLTADDLLRLGNDVRGELIRGVFCEMTPTGHEHGRIVASLTHELVAHVKIQQLGVVVAGDTGVQLEHEPDTVRAPDIAFTSSERLPVGQITHRYVQVVPDLVAEVVSPSDRHAEVRDKARMWLSCGVQLVWVVFPVARTVEVHRVGVDATETLAEADHLDGGSVLPGFTCSLRRLFAA